MVTRSASCIHLQPVLGRFLNKCPLVLPPGHCSCLFPGLDSCGCVSLHSEGYLPNQQDYKGNIFLNENVDSGVQL